MKLLLAVGFLVVLTGCATSFKGEAHITPVQCVAKCQSWGMEIDSMVAIGEYSSACVCKPKFKSTNSSSSSSSSPAASAVGVIEQMRQMQRLSAQAVMTY